MKIKYSTYQKIQREYHRTCPEKESKISKIMSLWRLDPFEGNKIVRNIEGDYDIPKKALKDILDSLISTMYEDTCSNINLLKSKYDEACKKYLFHGKAISFSENTPTTFGRVTIMEPGYLAKLIEKANDKNVTDEQISNAVDKLISKTEPQKELTKREKKIRFNSKPDFITWEDKSGGIDPFDFTNLKLMKLKLCASLGLSHYMLDKKLMTILIEFKDDIKTATIADAQLYDYFEPRSPDKGYGMTSTWPFADIKTRAEMRIKSIILETNKEKTEKEIEIIVNEILNEILNEEEIRRRPEAIKQNILLGYLKGFPYSEITNLI
jgi:hypothetical protein